MATSSSAPPLTQFKLLSFDIYGTLIDWEGGIITALSPLKARLPSSHPFLSDDIALGAAFNRYERAVQDEQPSLVYSGVLAECYRRLGAELGVSWTEDEAITFGNSVGLWPAFPDTVAAMQTLGKYYKLTVLSNVDRTSFGKTLAGPLDGVKFDAIYTAQDIGSYKPNTKNFEYMLEHVKAEFGVEKGEVLQTAQSLQHDHEPAMKVGVESAWIARGENGVSGMGGEEEKFAGRVNYKWKFPTLGAMAAEVEKQFAAKA